MEKHDAIRIDGMIMGVQHSLEAIAWYMRNNVYEEECAKLVDSLGESKVWLEDVSAALYSAHPDIQPKQVDRTWDHLPRLTEPRLEKLVAVRVDGRLMGVLGSLDGIAHYMKDNLAEAEYSELVYSIASSMAAICDVSNALHSAFPDIVPKELMPPGKDE